MPVLVEPVAALVARRWARLRRRTATFDTLAVVAAHAVTVLACARLAGLRNSVADVAITAGVILGVALAAWATWTALVGTHHMSESKGS